MAEPEKESYGEFVPETEANTDDALSNLAGGVKDGEPFEREGKVNPDLVYTEMQDVAVEEKGCKSSLGLTTLGVMIPAIVFVAAKKRKE